MKKIFAFIILSLGIFAFAKLPVLADVGDMGFFGGITEGTRLPKTTDEIIAQAGKKVTNVTLSNLMYKEVSFVSGAPVELTGLMTVKYQGGVTDGADYGTYKVTYVVARSAASGDNYLTRNIVFNVNWRREGEQIIKDYEAATWAETLTINGQTYTVDQTQSHFSVSVLEDHTPGVTYVKGDMSVHAFYVMSGNNQTGAAAGGVGYDATGSISGYESAWSKTATQRINGEIYADGWDLSYQTRPSVSVYKTLQYSKNEPAITSFDGNYMEVMQNESGLSYDIFNVPIALGDIQTSGGASISVYNTFEQLPKYDLSAIKSNPAISDIYKLFSMGVLSGPTYQYDPNQLIKRGDFTAMLVKAVKLPITPPSTAKPTKNTPIEFTFPDVPPSRGDYPYIMAAYKAGIAAGRGQGMFYPDYALQREEAICMIMRTLGLSNLGLEPTNETPFADDKDISPWAKQDIYAALKIGFIQPDASGNINPKQTVSKAEAAALVNALIEYMRDGMRTDYTEHIVDYTD